MIKLQLPMFDAYFIFLMVQNQCSRLCGLLCNAFSELCGTSITDLAMFGHRSALPSLGHATTARQQMGRGQRSHDSKDGPGTPLSPLPGPERLKGSEHGQARYRQRTNDSTGGSVRPPVMCVRPSVRNACVRVCV